MSWILLCVAGPLEVSAPPSSGSTTDRVDTSGSTRREVVRTTAQATSVSFDGSCDGT
jgi:hypothetical protein